MQDADAAADAAYEYDAHGDDPLAIAAAIIAVHQAGPPPTTHVAEEGPAAATTQPMGAGDAHAATVEAAASSAAASSASAAAAAAPTQPLEDDAKPDVKPDPKPDPSADPEVLTIAVREQPCRDMFFKIRSWTPFAKVFETFFEKRKGDVEPGRCKFLFDGERLQGSQTPAGVGMNDGDVIDAFMEQVGGGAP